MRQHTFSTNVAVASIEDAPLVKLGVLFKRVAGLADAIEIACNTKRLTLWLRRHAFLRDLSDISECD
jgi:hypothetical protein